jgi:hypothetical protein
VPVSPGQVQIENNKVGKRLFVRAVEFIDLFYGKLSVAGFDKCTGFVKPETGIPDQANISAGLSSTINIFTFFIT